MTIQGSTFPAFIRVENDAAGSARAFAEFSAGIDANLSTAKRKFETSYGEINAIVSRALSGPRTATGALDLDVAGARQSAAALEARAAATRQIAEATRLAAAAAGDFSAQARVDVAAANALEVSDRNAATAARVHAGALEQLQAQLAKLPPLHRAAAIASEAQASAGRAVGASLAGNRFAYIQVGQQLQDVTVSLAGGQHAATIFAQQLPQLAFALANVEATAGTFAARLGSIGTFLSGPWGAAVFAGTTALAFMAQRFFQTGDAAKAADDATTDFGNKQNEIGRFIDLATGKLINQNRVLVQNAILKRQAAIDEAGGKIVTARNTIAARIQAASATATGGSEFVAERQPSRPTYSIDRELLGITQTGGIRDFDRRLGELAARRPELRALRAEISGLAAGAENLYQERGTRQAEIGLLTGKTGALSQYDAITGKARDLIGHAARGGGGGGGAAGLRGVSSAADDAGAATRQLDADLSSIVSRFDPARKAADDYAETLAKIGALEAAGRLSAGDAVGFRITAARDESARRDKAGSDQADAFYRASGVDVNGDFSAMLKATIGARDALFQGSDALRQAADDARSALESGAADLSQAFASVFGRRAGSVVDTALGASFGKSFAKIDTFAATLGRSVHASDRTQRAITDLTATLGQALLGASIGKSVAKAVVGGSGSAAGGEIGGALGSAVLKKALPKLFSKLGDFAGPLGSIAGGLLGGVIGGLFHKTKTGSASITSLSGDASLSGNNGGLRTAASGLASNVQGALQSIVDQLGGTSGGFNVSIGQRDKKFVVDPTGAGRTKGSGVLKFADEAAATRAAILDAINDGAVQGLRAGALNLLKAGKDLDAQLQKAVRFQSVFTELKRYTNPVGAAIDDLNSSFSGLKAIFTEAGASTEEFASLEELYQKKRVDVTKQATDQLLGSLKSLQADLLTGDNGLSLSDRLKNALTSYSPLASDIQAGKTVDYDAFATQARLVLDIQRQLSGSQDDYFARFSEVTSLTAKALSDQENIVSIANATNSPFDASKPVVSAVDTMNAAITDALNAQLGAVNGNLARIIANTANDGGGGRSDYSLAAANF